MYVNPRVTMIMDMIGSPINGRSTRRSTTRPSKTEKTMVMIKEAKKLSPKSSVIERQMYAPTIMNSPWARLRIDVDL